MFDRKDSTWGLNRISSLTSVENSAQFVYTYDNKAGEGSDIYILDTGIFIKHPDFGKRASWGTTFGGYEDADGNGHGTHCAGTAISST